MLTHAIPSPLTSSLAIAAMFFLLTPPHLLAIDFKKKAIQLAVCGGGAYGGYRLGEKMADLAVKRLNLVGTEAEKHRRAIQLGTAAALCGAGYYLTGTVYANLSKRDRAAREKEYEAALEDANPGTRTFVLPDSNLQGTLTTEAPQVNGDKQCRWAVETLSKDGEPARTQYCRKSANDKYELQVF